MGDQQKCYFHTFEFHFFSFSRNVTCCSPFLYRLLVLVLLQHYFPTTFSSFAQKPVFPCSVHFYFAKSHLPDSPGLLYSTHGCPSLLCLQLHNAPGLLYSTHGAQVCCDLLILQLTLLMIPEVCTTRIPKDVHVSSLFCS